MTFIANFFADPKGKTFLARHYMDYAIINGQYTKEAGKKLYRRDKKQRIFGFRATNVDQLGFFCSS